MTTRLCVLVLACYGLTLVAAQGPPAAPAAAARTTATSTSGNVHVLPVQKSVYMIVTPSGNVGVQIGNDGVLLVDTGTAALAPEIFAAVRTLSDKPIHTIVNTHLHADHTGGNVAIVKAGGGGPQPVRVMAHENTFNRMMDAAVAANAGTPSAAMPMNTYFTPTRDFFLNGEAIILYHVAAAHTDGDTLVYFRGSDVVSVGDVFSPELYPAIDAQNGGSVNGLIAALNRVLEITVPAKYQEGGTYVIPGHGRPCDEAEVVEYRDMVTIVRDRIADLIKKKQSLQQVKAARPSRDYDAEYGAGTGPSSPDAFVEAVFNSLSKKP
jgi:glyoxylase-like metal-dependent hydrolase (beta-lactamase superfamily II)